MIDRQFYRKVNNRILFRLYNFCCWNEVEKLYRKNGWKKCTPQHTKMIEKLIEDLKPAFIEFAQSGPATDISSIENLPILFSEYLMYLERRKKLEKIRKKVKNQTSDREKRQNLNFFHDSQT